MRDMRRRRGCPQRNSVIRDLTLFCALFVVASGCGHSPSAGRDSADAQASEEVLDAYRIPTRFVAEERRVPRGTTLAGLLEDSGIAPEEVYPLIEQVTTVLPPRDVRAGATWRTYYDATSGRPAAIVYESRPDSFIRIALGDSLAVEAINRPVQTRVRNAVGTIESSLYEVLIGGGHQAALALALSEIFAWQIDFYRLYPGDSFFVQYEEEYIGDEPIGIGQIEVARFTHRGTTFFAHAFDVDGSKTFFDENGLSLRKAFLISPVRFSRLTSRYSPRRFHPVQGRYKPHLGTDYAAPTGTPIRATGDGIVVEARYGTYNGRYVKIRHNGTYTTQYLHMSRFATGIREGSFVRQGETIGYVGSTGLATGPHVCYRFWKNGQQVDHLREEFPATEPIPDTLASAYQDHLDDHRLQLRIYDHPFSDLTEAAVLF